MAETERQALANQVMEWLKNNRAIIPTEQFLALERILYPKKQASGEGSSRESWHVETAEEREQKAREIINQPGGYGSKR